LELEFLKLFGYVWACTELKKVKDYVWIEKYDNRFISVSSQISDLRNFSLHTTYARSDLLHGEYADKTDF